MCGLMDEIIQKSTSDEQMVVLTDERMIGWSNDVLVTGWMEI